MSKFKRSLTRNLNLKEELQLVHQDLQILMEWQTANLVLHALAEFVWDYISIPDKAELHSYGMFDFLDLYYGRFSSPPKKNVAYRIYRKIPEKLQFHTEHVNLSKSSVSTNRKRVAHPVIDKEELEIFLQQLGDGTPDLDPLEIVMFNHLKTTSNSKHNIERAARRAR